MGKRKILSVIRSIAEHKNDDNYFALDTITQLYITAFGRILDLSNPTQGSNGEQRIGDKTTGTSLEFYHTCYPTQSDKCPPVYTYRITIFIWKDDTIPEPGDLYDKPGTGSNPLNNSVSIWSFNHDKRVKRKILYDKSFTCHSQQVGNPGIAYTAQNANTQQTIRINLSKIKRGLNIINFENGSQAGINKIYASITNNVDAVKIQDGTLVPYEHYVHGRYNFIDM